MAKHSHSRDEGKGAQTRAHILDTALGLFREPGFDKTTMRDVASAAGMSTGAAYYYFATKEAIVLAYYEKVASERARRVRDVFERTLDLRERVQALYDIHFDVVGQDRKLLGALVRSVADPDSETAVFSQATRSVRDASIALFREAVSVPQLPDEELRELGALGLWTLDLALMLYFTWDDSPKQQRTRQLIEDALDALLPMVPLLSLPMAAPMREHLKQTLARAALLPRAALDDDAGSA
jgi:AcrR family transcriptional regulator